MEPAPLHPNLARVAARYDLVTGEFAAGRISVDEARRQLAELVARDDQGVRWRIDPASGEWCRQTLDGGWVCDDPPTFGLATPDGWDLSGGIDPFADPRRNITTRDVDITRVTDTTSLTGATLRAASPQPAPRPLPRGHSPSGSPRGRLLRWVVAGLLVTGAAVVGVHSCGNDDAPSAGATTTTTTTTAGEGRAEIPG